MDEELEQNQQIEMVNSMQYANEIKDALIKIKQNGPIDFNQGFCVNVRIQLNTLMASNEFVEFMFLNSSKWEFFSGSKFFPIEGSSTHFSLPGKWEGVRGRMRYDLIDFLLNELEKIYVQI